MQCIPLCRSTTESLWTSEMWFPWLANGFDKEWTQDLMWKMAKSPMILLLPEWGRTYDWDGSFIFNSSPNPDGHSGVKCRGSCPTNWRGGSHPWIAVTLNKGFLILKNEKQLRKEAEQLPIYCSFEWFQSPAEGRRLWTGLERLLELSALCPSPALPLQRTPSASLISHHFHFYFFSFSFSFPLIIFLIFLLSISPPPLF